MDESALLSRAEEAEAKLYRLKLAFEYALELLADRKAILGLLAANSARYLHLRNESRLIATNSGLMLALFEKTERHRLELDAGVDAAIAASTPDTGDGK